MDLTKTVLRASPRRAEIRILQRIKVLDFQTVVM